MDVLVALLNRILSSPLGQVITGTYLAPNKRLGFQLLWMAMNDQKARNAFLNGKKWNDEIDIANTQTMKHIIARYGWPGERLVGLMGAQASWLLVQHADHDREFQKQCHALLEAAVQNNDAQSQNLAYLTDRICVGDGVPQIFGTQWEHPIVDAEHVDERRAKVGLPPLAESVAQSKEMMEEVKQRKGRWINK